MSCRRLAGAVLTVVVAASLARAENQPAIGPLLEHPVIDSSLALAEVQRFVEARILPMPEIGTVEAWEKYAEKIRREMFERVVFRGAAAGWRSAEPKVEWLETVPGGPGYQIRKLRYEALPGLWIPALLYVPDHVAGKVPVVLNTNGHASTGKVTPYKQIRCINEAKRGMIALNPEWLGMGQLGGADYGHHRMNQLDLCGTSGLAPFYLALERGLDLLLSLEHADPERVAVAGLSGGGWQTIVIGALDPRVTLANPVAGYSSFFTRVRNFADLGDSEQTPVDMAITADYAHLTALRAPRPTLLTYNAKDNCCFVADGALPPLLKAAGPVFELYGKRASLRSHVNYWPGTHNFELENRLELYRMFGEHFFAGQADYPFDEIPSGDEVQSKEQLHVEIPPQNANFHSLALALARDLPTGAQLPSAKEEVAAWQDGGRRRLARLVRATRYNVKPVASEVQAVAGGSATYWQLQMDDSWTVPVVELTRGEPAATTILVADEGRRAAVADAERLLAAGHRVLAVDPFCFGESSIEKRNYLMALFVAAVGQPALGIDASQLAAVARWSKKQYGAGPVTVCAVGPRSSLYGLIAAALETEAVSGVELRGSFGSLKEVIERNMSVNETPELFCFGLLEQFDVQQIAALVAPRPVTFPAPSERVRVELADLKSFYAMLGVDFEPLP